MKRLAKSVFAPLIGVVDRRFTFIAHRLDHLQGLVEASRRETQDVAATNRALLDIIEANSIALARLQREIERGTDVATKQ